jgi:hypothetical protein
VPTTQPRYAVTDTGALRAMLDDAAARWPDVDDRRRLLLLLVATGHEVVRSELDAGASDVRQSRQREALARIRELVDADALLADAAWR